MSGRENILNAVAKNKPAFIALPEMVIDRSATNDGNLVDRFTNTLESIGGKAIVVDGFEAIKNAISQAGTAGEWIVNTIAEAGQTDPQINSELDAPSMEKVFIAYIKGTVAVAENGAIWVTESQAVNRLLPFICQHLVLVINASDIVPTLHEAYKQIDIAEEGYGVFIAGPSKTADIEQALVIGAHGARSLTVYLIT